MEPGASSAAGSEGGSGRTALRDLPECCVAEIMLRLDPTQICRLAGVSQVFRGAASTDLLGLFAAVTLAIAVSKIRGKHFKLPPGPLPVPVFGNWLQVGDDLNHRNLTDLAKRFGHILLLRMGVRNLVVVSSPELAREVLHAQGVEFGSRTRNVVFDIFTGKGQDMVFTVYGDHWRKMRRIMTVPFFTTAVSVLF